MHVKPQTIINDIWSLVCRLTDLEAIVELAVDSRWYCDKVCTGIEHYAKLARAQFTATLGANCITICASCTLTALVIRLNIASTSVLGSAASVDGVHFCFTVSNWCSSRVRIMVKKSCTFRWWLPSSRNLAACSQRATQPQDLSQHHWHFMISMQATHAGCHPWAVQGGGCQPPP